ncbi:Tox-REase-5 domain-containing protein [Streptomyces sp. NBC_01022]|uniref:Tox-REase-5 domain-containing protein n=1 Tax=Streptomyces sp. NBC_01022 TaxID=2903723 RepID=UPI002DDB3F5C|nr:Tox-REase-5 domain-containing protein [Streptomyces sp. NBC_01022]WRZ81039.1 restriction endonuclease fold toxin 5 domain-containing protein [Streptomyces sp. NBC_01022]
MSATGGISAYGGVGPAPGAGRRALPRAMGAARLLLHVLFGATLLGGVGLFGSALAADALDGVVVGLLLYGAVPGVVGWLLSRRVWTGGRGVWGGLVAVQVWLIIGGAANAADGSMRGFTQVFLPVLILVFLTRQESREWFRLQEREREDKPDFSLPHMITWRRDRGQSTLEYVGLVMLVAAVVVALLLSGVGGPMADRFQAAVCSVTGTSCPATGTGSGTVNAGDSAGGADAGGADEGATVVGGADGGGASAGTGGASAGTGDASGAAGAGGATEGGAGGSTGGPAGADASGGSGSTDGSDTAGSSGSTDDTGGSDTTGGTGTTGTTGETGGPDSTGGPDGSGTDRPGTETYPETAAEPEAAYDDIPASGEDESGDSGDSDGGEDKEDCSGWGFFGCAWDRGTQVVEGVFVDGIWGDVTGVIDLFKPSTWSGIVDYGKQLGSQWTDDSKDATSKWDKGDYLGAFGDWGKASLNTVVKVGDDMFVGDDVRERWNNGEKTRAVTDVVWNVGSLFIPGYDVAKVVGKTSRLGHIGKIASDVAEAAEDAGAASRRARKAAEAGDVDGVRKAAKEADDAADKAEDSARRTGCSIASGPLGPRTRYGGTGVAGSGTGVLAAGPADHVILADDGCDKAAEAKAKEARDQERAAWTDKKRAEEADRAAKALAKKKPWPDAQRNDTSDPRNYNSPDWAKDLKDPELGSADAGDGYWGSRDRNPKPNWKNESWLRYQEQITGTNRGKEYIVANPKEGKPPVEYDGWDSGRQTFLEAKNGYKSYLSKGDSGTLTPSGREKFVKEATEQVNASGGRPVEWHFSDPDVAKAARKAFRDEGLPIKVVYSKQNPELSTRKPGAFD